MPDVQEVFRMSTQKIRPETGFNERQVQHQRRTARNRKVGTFAVVAAIVVIAVVAMAAAWSEGRETHVPAVSPTQAPTQMPTQDATATSFLDVDTSERVGELLPGLT
jgi:hypothetical protein